MTLRDKVVRAAPIAVARALMPGLALAGVVGMAAHFVAGLYGGPPILFALLLGTSLGFLSEDVRTGPGLDFAAKAVLGLAVALLGSRVTAADLISLGWSTAAMVIAAVVLTVAAGWAFGRLCGLRNDHAVLSAAAVAVCGTAAALAVSAALPAHKDRQATTLITAIAVTVLGTAAMIAYPWLTLALGLDDSEAGIFLGATIHNVAQAVGAGYMVSGTAGESATLVKLMRVALLIPVVMTVGLLFRQPAAAVGRRRLHLPWFLVGFLLLAGMNTSGLLNEQVAGALAEASSACIITAIAALGITTSARDLLRAGLRPVAAALLQTLFLGLFVGLWLWASIPGE